MTAETASAMDGYVAKLERRRPLPPDARAELLALPATIVKAEAQDVIVEEGAASHASFFLTSGFLSRQKRAGNRRQILAFAIAGDAVDLQSLWFRVQDHSLVAHKKTTLIAVEHREIAALCERAPAVAKALWHDTLVDAAIFREWTLNVGHRRAPDRIGHLFLELVARCRAHGLIHNDVVELPVTQSDLASALGLSLVHLNKSLKSLRDRGLIHLEGRILTILERAALERTTDFDPAYLHIETEPTF